LGSGLQERRYGVEQDREAARREVFRPRAGRGDRPHAEPVPLRGAYDAIDGRLDLRKRWPAGKPEREREVARAHDETVDAGNGGDLFDASQRLGRLDLRKQERLTVRARDPRV